MAVKLSLTQHYHFILICAVSRREGDDAIATMSLKRRFIVSEKGRMINIICIIIFFILSHLSPSPDPRQGVRQGGPYSGQPVTSSSVWRAKPRPGLAGGGWLVLLLATQPPPDHQGMGEFFLNVTEASFLPFPKGGSSTFVFLARGSPLGRGHNLGLRTLFEMDQVEMCPETTQEWGHPVPTKHCWQD